MERFGYRRDHGTPPKREIAWITFLEDLVLWAVGLPYWNTHPFCWLKKYIYNLNFTPSNSWKQRYVIELKKSMKKRWRQWRLTFENGFKRKLEKIGITSMTSVYTADKLSWYKTHQFNLMNIVIKYLACSKIYFINTGHTNI